MNADISISLVEPRDFTAALGRLIRLLRQRNRWTQPELSSRAGVPTSTLSRLERTGLASTDRLARVLFALDAIDDFHSFVQERCHLADLPENLESFHPGIPRLSRIRHSKRKESGK